MAVRTVNQEGTSPVAVHRMFKSLTLERHVLLSKAHPHVFKSCEIIQGNGGVGTVHKTTFVEGFHFTYLLHKIEELDTENYYFKYTLFEGGQLRDNLECIVYEAKLEAAGEGCKGKLITHFHPKHGCSVPEEVVKVLKQNTDSLFKLIGEYLFTHPDVCT